jgi:hypothetical protein
MRVPLCHPKRVLNATDSENPEKTSTRKIPNPSVTDRVLEYGVEIPDDTLEEGEAR